MYAVITNSGITFKASTYEECKQWVNDNPSTDWIINEWHPLFGWQEVIVM